MPSKFVCAAGKPPTKQFRANSAMRADEDCAHRSHTLALKSKHLWANYSIYAVAFFTFLATSSVIKGGNVLQFTLARCVQQENITKIPPIPSQVPAWAWCRPFCPLQKIKAGKVYDHKKIPRSRSQSGEEAWIYDNVFYGKENGIFLEMGALNGITYSNTWWLEKIASWRGVLIEPSAVSYRNLTHNRPQGLMFNVAICSEFSTVHYTHGSKSGATNGIWEFMSPSYRKLWHPNVTNTSQLVEVACVPLNYLLQRYQITTIDFWSLDVEGGELEVLKQFDFSAVKINAMVVEMDHHDSGKNKKILELLKNVRLLPVHKDGKNYFFVHESYMAYVSSAPGLSVAALKTYQKLSPKEIAQRRRGGRGNSQNLN